MQVEHNSLASVSQTSLSHAASASLTGARVTPPAQREDTVEPSTAHSLVTASATAAPQPADPYTIPVDPELGSRYRNRPFIVRHKATITSAIAVAVTFGLGFGLGFGLTHGNTHNNTKSEPALNPSAAPSHTASATASWAVSTSASMTAAPTSSPTVVSPLQDPTFEPQAGPGDKPLQPFDVALFPAGLPTVGDVHNHGVPDGGARHQIKELAFKYPDYVQSIVAQQTNTTFELSVFSPNGTPIALDVDNKFIANNGSLVQTGSKGGNANWATVLEKGVAKWKTVFAPSNTSYYGLANATGSDVLRIFTPHGTLTNITATPLRTSIHVALHALNVTFNGLPQNATEALAPLFKSALCNAEAGNTEGLRCDVRDFTAEVKKSNRSSVAAYDNLVSGLHGVEAWVNAVAKC